MFYFWLAFIVLIARSKQCLILKMLYEILDCGVRPWFPNMGKVLYTLEISKMGLVSDLFGRQKIDMYIDSLV